MASKKFSRQLCVYCQERQSTTTGDHIFARQFFLETARKDLPKAPCCDECGGLKSKDEHYLTAVLPFGGRHADARENLTGMVPKRLARNEQLRRELSDGLDVSDGRATVIPLDTNRVQRLFERVTVGLLWHTWGVYLPSTHAVQSALLTPTGDAFFDRLFEMNAANRVSVNLGSGTFEYAGAQGTDDSALSIWRYRVYGGLQMTGDRSHPDVVIQHVGCVTARREMLNQHPLT